MESRAKIEPVTAPIVTPQNIETKDVAPLTGNENVLKDTPTAELEIWEGESKKKYANEYFNTHNIGHEFTVKMPIALIDKYVRAEIEERGYAKTTQNYQQILNEIETQIGSKNLELFKRLTKITGYIRALKTLQNAKKLKEKYMI